MIVIGGKNSSNTKKDENNTYVYTVNFEEEEKGSKQKKNRGIASIIRKNRGYSADLTDFSEN